MAHAEGGVFNLGAIDAGEDGQEGFSQQDVLGSAGALQRLAQSDPHQAAGLVQGCLDALAGLCRLLLQKLSAAAETRGESAKQADLPAELPSQVHTCSAPCAFCMSQVHVHTSLEYLLASYHSSFECMCIRNMHQKLPLVKIAAVADIMAAPTANNSKTTWPRAEAQLRSLWTCVV